MSDSPVNLADPDCEPSDEDFAGFLERAFAHLRDDDEKRLAKMRAEIAKARADVMRRLGLST